MAEVSPARGIYDVLKAHTPDLTEGGNWHFAYGRLVEHSKPMIVVRNTGGRSAEPVIAQDYPTVQLIGRGVPGAGGAEDLYLKMRACRDALVGIPSRPPSWINLSSITAIGEITDVGFDDKDRAMFTLNLQLIVWFETSGYREAV